MAEMIADPFEAQLARLIPRMRVWALALTKNAAAADDLVQDTAAKALINKATFLPDTNFTAWMHRIMLHHFISGVRRRREFVSVEEMPDVAIAAEQHSKVELERLSFEFDRLPKHLREVLRQVAIEQRSYEEVATASGCAVGTLKSRVHRARATLRTRLEGSETLVT